MVSSSFGWRLPVGLFRSASGASSGSARRKALAHRLDASHRERSRAPRAPADAAPPRCAARGRARLPPRAGSARPRLRRSRPAQRCPVHSPRSWPSRLARSRGAPSAGRNSMRPGSNWTRCTLPTEMRAQHRLALLVEQREHLEQSSAASGRGRHRHRLGAGIGVVDRRRQRAAAGADDAPRRRIAPLARQRRRGARAAGRGAGAATLVGTALPPPPARTRTSSAGRRQIGDIGEAHQHHLGRLDRRGRGLHLGEALQQHLPGAGEHRHRERLGQRPGALAIAFERSGRRRRRRAPA